MILERFDVAVNEAARQEQVILQILSGTKADSGKRERVVSLLLSDDQVTALSAEASLLKTLSALLQDLKELKADADKKVREGELPSPQAATLNMRIGAFNERLEAMAKALDGRVAGAISAVHRWQVD